VAQNTVYDLRTAIFNKLERLPLKYYDRHAHGDTLSRVVNDLDTIGNTLQQSITQLIRSVVLLTGIIIMMFTISPILTLIALIMLAVCILLISPFMKKPQNYLKELQEQL